MGKRFGLDEDFLTVYGGHFDHAYADSHVGSIGTL
jgi:hypothetical protein